MFSTTTWARGSRMAPRMDQKYFTVYAAKKKGGKKGQNKKNKGPSVLKPTEGPKPYLSTPVIMQNLLMIESYFRKTGRPLFEEEVEISDVAELLWNAPFAILAHNNNGDPTFEYGNKAALDLFECEWSELIGTPSRESAAPDKEIQEDRSALLAQALEKGYVDDYEGWRKSFKGKPFKVSNATIFNIESPDGAAVGQGAVLRQWEYEDGTQGGPLATAVNSQMETDTETLRLAQERVDAHAANVRMLKEDKGLSNSDEEVKKAVQELLAAKSDLEQMTKS